MTKVEQLQTGDFQPGTATELFNKVTASKPRYVMIGGFLGAGKTTCVLQLARFLNDQEIRVGLITNDQGSNLVDTAMLLANGFMVEEVTGGCFCCKFNSLIEASKNLVAANVPNVFIAEPVGSCTDLLASVYYPLQKMYGDNVIVSPLTIVVDPLRAQRVFGLASGNRLSEKVVYIYKKQLEEAEIILINKTDLLPAQDLEALKQKLATEFTGTEIYLVSARQPETLHPWFHRILLGAASVKMAVDVDYEIYGDGEILLGWLNGIFSIQTESGFDGNAFTLEFGRRLADKIQSNNGAIGHLKLTLDPGTGFGDIAVVNAVRNDASPELSQELSEEVFEGELIVNVRAETSPEILEQAVRDVLEEMRTSHPTIVLTISNLEAFRPGRPVRPVDR